MPFPRLASDASGASWSWILATQGSITTARTAYSALFTCVTIAQSSSVHFNSVSF